MPTTIVTYVIVRRADTEHLGNLRGRSPSLVLALPFPGTNDVGVVIQVSPSINLRPSPEPIARPHRPRLHLSIPSLPGFLRTMHTNTDHTTTGKRKKKEKKKQKTLAPPLIAPILLHTLHKDTVLFKNNGQFRRINRKKMHAKEICKRERADMHMWNASTLCVEKKSKGRRSFKTIVQI